MSAYWDVITEKVSDYNALATKHNLKSRLKYDSSFSLLLGCEEQFEVGNCECVLVSCNNQRAVGAVEALIHQICFEYGE